MPNSRQVSPVTDDDREASRPNNEDGAAQGQHVQPVRRDENSISFRHFLQPHSDVVPPPAPQCRNRNRAGNNLGSVDLVDMAVSGLPDFVQDHLVVESLSISDHPSGGPTQAGSSSVDLNVLNEILPDFATSQPAHPLPAHSVQTRRRNIPEEPASAPEVHGAAALPDFLSDGPMQCTDSNTVDNAASSTSRSASRMIPSSSRMVDEASRSTSFDSSENIRSEVERLRRDLAERNRRISHLEGEVVRLRTNISALESALRAAEQNALASHMGAGDAPSSSLGIRVNGKIPQSRELDAQAVRELAQSSETLISQLLQNMARLKRFNPSSEDHSQMSSDEEKENV